MLARIGFKIRMGSKPYLTENICFFSKIPRINNYESKTPNWFIKRFYQSDCIADDSVLVVV